MANNAIKTANIGHPIQKRAIFKELRAKANDFLNSRQKANNLVDIISSLEQAYKTKTTALPSLFVLEIVFKELLKRREMRADCDILKPRNEEETKYKEWLLERYEQAFNFIVEILEHEKIEEAAQALSTSMKLIQAEAKYPVDQFESDDFPKRRLRHVLQKLISPHKPQILIIQRFKEYGEYLDIVYHSWKLMHQLATRAAFQNPILANNYIEVIYALHITEDMYNNRKILCPIEEKSTEKDPFDYLILRRQINKVWNFVMQWSDGANESVHKKVMITLLERILPHLEKPILLTDYLMDSLDCGGAVSLLALHGIYLLIQKQNITYPDIYEKLYSMFEPEIFHTKFKARLFYLADIFLTSTHLPEYLVAAFAKRLARLSLIAPPQDVIIILYFIGNLIVRHNGLKRLICAENAFEKQKQSLNEHNLIVSNSITLNSIVSCDPYIMEERNPMNSKALESQLWEILTLQKHTMPEVANAAKFISKPLPKIEWELSKVLEIDESNIFDEEISKKATQYALALEQPGTQVFLNDDKIKDYWDM